MLALLAVAGLCACATAPTAVRLSGVGVMKTQPFVIEPGYYTIARDVRSRSTESCYFSAQLEGVNGGVAADLVGLDLAPAAHGTLETEKHYVNRGEYVLNVTRGCGDWEVRILPQEWFDAETKATKTGVARLRQARPKLMISSDFATDIK